MQRLAACSAALFLLASCEAWRLERSARDKCDQGLVRIRRCQTALGLRPFPEEEREKLLEELLEGVQLIMKGLSEFSDAHDKSGRSYNVRPYIEALKAARMMKADLAR